MKVVIHQGLTLERWFKFSLVEQLANVGADVDRALGLRQKGNAEFCQKAFERALELIDLTVEDPKHRKKGSLKEILRVREALVDFFVYDNEYQTTEEFWRQYFFNFNYMAAIQRGR